MTEHELAMKKQILTLQGMFLTLQARVEAIEKELDVNSQIAALEKMIKERGEDKSY